MSALARANEKEWRWPAVAAVQRWEFVSWIMSHNRRSWPIFRRTDDPSDAFMDYLEGYASTMDIYQLYPRPPHRDVSSVVDDF